MAFRGATAIKTLVSMALLGAGLLAQTPASAEVSLGEAGGWEAYTDGRVNAFITLANGDAYPPNGGPDGTGPNLIAGAGMLTIPDDIPPDPPPIDPATGMPFETPQGTINKWRVRSGYMPNVLGIGVRGDVAEGLKASAFLAIWGTIESTGQRKYFPVLADFREGWGKLEGGWGSVTVGRTLTLYGRGITNIARDYGHDYGVGAHVNLDNTSNNPEFRLGPTGGMTGFGVLSASYSPGLYYTTPSLGGLEVSLGVYDPATFSGSWNRATLPRLEFEVAYGLESDAFLADLFLAGAWQKVFQENQPPDIEETISGIGAGGRVEFGPIHLGGGVHSAKGSGMWYAFAGHGANGDTNFAPPVMVDDGMGNMVRQDNSQAPRDFFGFSVFAQYGSELFDINAGFGQSTADEHPIDNQFEIDPMTGMPVLDPMTMQPVPLNDDSLIKSQTGIFGAFIYHFDDNFHANLDVMQASFEWHEGESQDVTFFNLGATIDW